MFLNEQLLALMAKVPSGRQKESDAFWELATKLQFVSTLVDLQFCIHESMRISGFWEEDKSVGESIALMHSELSEALEGHRKNLRAEHIYQEGLCVEEQPFSAVEEELADLVIRVLDFSGRHELRLGEAIVAKQIFNLTRPFKHGKSY